MKPIQPKSIQPKPIQPTTRFTGATILMLRRRLLAMFSLVFGLLFALNAHATDRVALVIGNANYESIGQLKNPLNDANAVANHLQQLGFRVITANDSGRAQLLRALNDFTQQVNRETEIALFYYSGHGLQYEGESYLIPVDAHIETGADVPITAINAKNILNKIQKQNSAVSIMVLDACRNMPFNRGSKDISVGLASIKANDGGSTIIAYATAEGAVASDGVGTHSPYTAAFLNQVKKDIPLSQLFNNIAYQVKQATGQDPWISQSSIPPHIKLAKLTVQTGANQTNTVPMGAAQTGSVSNTANSIASNTDPVTPAYPVSASEQTQWDMPGDEDNSHRYVVPDGASVSPSFNCSQARLAVEYAICRSSPLARLDNQMVDLYLQKIKTVYDVKSTQSEWIKERNSCGSHYSCLEMAYQHRILQLQAIPKHPSFNCLKARTANERSICQTVVLAELDSKMAALYRQKLNLNDPKITQWLKSTRRTWLKERELCGYNIDCTYRSYRGRIDQLSHVR